MKKTYGKPDIMFDSFQMCTSIAKVCEVRVTAAENVCGLKWTGTTTIFATGISDCNMIVDIDVETQSWNGICYHVPVENNNLFNS